MILLELLNMVTRLWHAYERMLQTHPIITKIAVASPMFALTDVAVQTIEQRRDKDLSREGKRGSDETTLDLRRTATQALFGVYYATVHAHFIWGRLEVLFGGVTDILKTRLVLEKHVQQQAVPMTTKVGRPSLVLCL